jgi:hypothetical protein
LYSLACCELLDHKHNVLNFPNSRMQTNTSVHGDGHNTALYLAALAVVQPGLLLLIALTTITTCHTSCSGQTHEESAPHLAALAVVQAVEVVQRVGQRHLLVCDAWRGLLRNALGNDLQIEEQQRGYKQLGRMGTGVSMQSPKLSAMPGVASSGMPLAMTCRLKNSDGKIQNSMARWVNMQQHLLFCYA